MLFNKQKLATLIIKGLSDTSNLSDVKKEDSKDSDSESESKMASELAMEKFISAVKSDNAKEAVKALKDCMDCMDGETYIENDVSKEV